MSLMSMVNEHDKNFKEFLLYAHEGFVKGEKEHGEGSNERMDLIEEAKRELRDCACYAYFLFCRLNRIEKLIKEGGVK